MILHVDCSQLNGAIYKCSKRCMAEQKNKAHQQVLFHELLMKVSEYVEQVGPIDGFDMNIQINGKEITGSFNK